MPRPADSERKFGFPTRGSDEVAAAAEASGYLPLDRAVARTVAIGQHRPALPRNASGRTLLLFITSFLLCWLASCNRSTPFNPSSLTFLIEANPINLDPRFATDGQSQRLDALIFSGLLTRDTQMNLRGDLAAAWENPDPLAYVFHLKPNIKFHDGHPLTSADVKATFDFILNPANKSPKRGAFRMVEKVEAPDPLTVVSVSANPTPLSSSTSSPTHPVSSPQTPAQISRAIRSVPAPSNSSASRKTKTCSSSATKTISTARRRSNFSISASCPMPSSALSNSAKAPPTWK
jgi:hypothetical protein